VLTDWFLTVHVTCLHLLSSARSLHRLGSLQYMRFVCIRPMLQQPSCLLARFSTSHVTCLHCLSPARSLRQLGSSQYMRRACIASVAALTCSLARFLTVHVTCWPRCLTVHATCLHRLSSLWSVHRFRFLTVHATCLRRPLLQQSTCTPTCQRPWSCSDTPALARMCPHPPIALALHYAGSRSSSNSLELARLNWRHLQFPLFHLLVSSCLVCLCTSRSYDGQVPADMARMT
jgi:hypothetical protein